MFWIWALGVDIGMVIVRQFKTFRYYMELHATFMFILCALTISMETLILVYMSGSLWPAGDTMK